MVISFKLLAGNVRLKEAREVATRILSPKEP